MAKNKKDKNQNNMEAEKLTRELKKVNMEAGGEFQLEDAKKQAGKGNPKNNKR